MGLTKPEYSGGAQAVRADAAHGGFNSAAPGEVGACFGARPPEATGYTGFANSSSPALFDAAVSNHVDDHEIEAILRKQQEQACEATQRLAILEQRHALCDNHDKNSNEPLVKRIGKTIGVIPSAPTAEAQIMPFEKILKLLLASLKGQFQQDIHRQKCASPVPFNSATQGYHPMFYVSKERKLVKHNDLFDGIPVRYQGFTKSTIWFSKEMPRYGIVARRMQHQSRMKQKNVTDQDMASKAALFFHVFEGSSYVLIERSSPADEVNKSDLARYIVESAAKFVQIWPSNRPTNVRQSQLGAQSPTVGSPAPVDALRFQPQPMPNPPAAVHRSGGPAGADHGTAVSMSQPALKLAATSAHSFPSMSAAAPRDLAAPTADLDPQAGSMQLLTSLKHGKRAYEPSSLEMNMPGAVDGFEPESKRFHPAGENYLFHFGDEPNVANDFDMLIRPDSYSESVSSAGFSSSSSTSLASSSSGSPRSTSSPMLSPSHAGQLLHAVNNSSPATTDYNLFIDAEQPREVAAVHQPHHYQDPGLAPLPTVKCEPDSHPPALGFEYDHLFDQGGFLPPADDAENANRPVEEPTLQDLFVEESDDGFGNSHDPFGYRLCHTIFKVFCDSMEGAQFAREYDRIHSLLFNKSFNQSLRIALDNKDPRIMQEFMFPDYASTEFVPNLPIAAVRMTEQSVGSSDFVVDEADKVARDILRMDPIGTPNLFEMMDKNDMAYIMAKFYWLQNKTSNYWFQRLITLGNGQLAVIRGFNTLTSCSSTGKQRWSVRFQDVSYMYPDLLGLPSADAF